METPRMQLECVLVIPSMPPCNNHGGDKLSGLYVCGSISTLQGEAPLSPSNFCLTTPLQPQSLEYMWQVRNSIFLSRSFLLS